MKIHKSSLKLEIIAKDGKFKCKDLVNYILSSFVRK